MLSLAMIAAGEEVQLVNIIGGSVLRKRLADLGLNTGMALRVIQADPQGPMILGVKDSRIALGRGMAQKVIVEIIA